MLNGESIGHVANTDPLAFDENADDIEAVGLGRASMAVDPDGRGAR